MYIHIPLNFTWEVGVQCTEMKTDPNTSLQNHHENIPTRSDKNSYTFTIQEISFLNQTTGYVLWTNLPDDIPGFIYFIHDMNHFL